MPGIIVGVDGSEHSRLALVWAVREAARHHLPLTVMTVFPHPARLATRIYWAEPDLAGSSFDPELARKAVREFVDKAVKETGEPAPEVTVNVVEGDRAEELIRASHDADVLVVGRRGTGGFAKLLMGSVSTQVMHHAACPVVVVPGTREAS